MNRLDEILREKRKTIAYLKGTCTQDYLMSVTYLRRPRPPVSAVVQAAPMGLIAEIKHKSPSAGVIREPFDPARIALAYHNAGAHAISVLIDGPFFGGDISHMSAVRVAVRLPMLYKDFVIDPWQVWQATSLGASAVLLIVAALTPKELRQLMDLCAQIGVEPLVEVHDAEELKRAADAGARFIGVNNRDLKTMNVSLDTSFRLAGQAPAGSVLVSESGIAGAADVRRLKEAGYHGVLVGEHLLRQQDLQAAVRDLMATVWASS